MVRQIILAGFVVFLPAGVQAQGRGMMPPVSHAVAVGPRVVMQAPRVGTAQVMPGTRTVSRGGVVRPRTAIPAARNTRRQVTTRRRFADEDNRLDQIAARRRDWDSTRYTRRRSADLEPRACGEAGFKYRFSSRFLTAGFHCRVLRWQ